MHPSKMLQQKKVALLGLDGNKGGVGCSFHGCLGGVGAGVLRVKEER